MSGGGGPRSQEVAGIEEMHSGMETDEQATPQAGASSMPAAVPGQVPGSREDGQTPVEELQVNGFTF